MEAPFVQNWRWTKLHLFCWEFVCPKRATLSETSVFWLPQNLYLDRIWVVLLPGPFFLCALPEADRAGS